jgi:hypothetical protein
MSRVLVELAGLAPAEVHTAELDLPRVELRLELIDPRTKEARALPAGPMVSQSMCGDEGTPTARK